VSITREATEQTPVPRRDPVIPDLGDAPLPPPDAIGDGATPAAVMAERRSDAAAAEEAEAETLANGPAWLAFYDPTLVHEVHITLPDASRQALASDARAWVPVSVDIDGVALSDVAMHLKGSTTFQGLDRKPSLKLKLDEYVPGQRHFGLRRVTLNNMVSDPAQAREVIALRLWWELGIPAPRSSWAHVWINDESYGLYSNIEPMDREWVKRRYRAAGGDLWEANDEADFTSDGIANWEGEGDRTRLTAIADALESSDGTLAERLADTVDLDSYLTYWAACLVTGSSDGYPFHLNDTFLYADPADGNRMHFSPWGMDESWGDSFGTWTQGELGSACTRDDECNAALDARTAELLDILEAKDLAAEVSEAFAVTDGLLGGDTRRPYPLADVQAARSTLKARVAGWPAALRAQLGL
jgi:spore coat protein CotH